MAYQVCNRCRKPVIPNASAFLQQSGTACMCGMPRMPSVGLSEPITGIEPHREYQLILPYPPVLNHLYATVGNRRVLSKEGRDYHAVAARFCCNMDVLHGPISVTIYAYRPRKQGDIDGIFKVLIDSLTGHAWKDDSQIVELHAYRRDDKLNPRVEVTIKEM